jgi:hypothetical protein
MRVVHNNTNPIGTNCTNANETIPIYIRGGLNDGDTVDLTIQSQKATLFKVKQQFTATLNTKATNNLDGFNDYKQFVKPQNPTISDRAEYVISNSTTNINEPVDERNGNFAFSLSGDFSGVKEARVRDLNRTLLATLNAANNWSNQTTISSSLNGTIEIEVTGKDMLTPRTFKVSIKTVPNTGNIAREIFLLKDVVSHEWLLPGVTYYLPFVVARPGDETYIVLQAKKGYKSSYTVTISALDDNGDFKSINAITMNAGDRLVIKASDIKAQVPSLTKDRFAVMINVDGDESQIFAYANICNANGICRRVPVKTQGGKIVE